MKFIQATDQAIDVANWKKHEELAEYPEGARDKTLLYCPSPSPYKFLTPGGRYLFKRSSPRYAEQFWVEILAYLIGTQMEIAVPQTFVAYNSETNQSGALIEWFLNPINLGNGNEIYIPGGDYCQRFIPNFDRKEGKQHNFEIVSQIFEAINTHYPQFNIDWKNFWAKTFLFDALIGNTDRHQDNWGIIVTSFWETPPTVDKIRTAPVFDNGTSMGHEIFPNKFKNFENKNYLEKYILKGSHHMKWGINDASRIGHTKTLERLISIYPETHLLMLNSLKKVNDNVFKNILNTLVSFNIPINLSTERAAFMLKLLQSRYQYLLHVLEK